MPSRHALPPITPPSAGRLARAHRRLVEGRALIRYAALAAALIVAVFATAGCTTADSDGVDRSGYEDLLRFIPDSEHARTLVVSADLDRFRDVAGLETPDETAGTADEREHVDLLLASIAERHPSLGVEFLGAGPNLAGELAVIAKQHLGIGLSDIDRFIRTRAGADRIFVAEGEFSRSTVEAALAACDDCEAPERDEYRGWEYLAWGDDGETSGSLVLQPPAYNREGRSIRLAIDEQYLLHATSDAELMRIVDAESGDDSLAAHDDLRLVAETADDAALLHLRMGAGDGSVAIQPPRPEAFEMLADAPEVLDYEADGTGSGITDGTPFLAYILVHESEDTANENAERVRQRAAHAVDRSTPSWLDSDSVDVETQGRAVLVTVQGSEALMDQEIAALIARVAPPS